jgi:methenyltetrahydrofolate cyclohydrolase
MDYRTEPLAKYLEDAAAARPTPGGGSVAAMAGALASTMTSMAAGFTTGPKFKAADGPARDAVAESAKLRRLLLDYAHQDMVVYEAIMAACKLPKATEAEKTARADAIRAATKASLNLVQQVMSQCFLVLALSRTLTEWANPNLISDVGVAAELALGAVKAARINIEVNLAGYDIAADAAAIRAEADGIVTEAERLAAETRQAVMTKLKR